MKRREVLKAGAAGAATVAVAGLGGGAGCATVAPVDPAHTDRAAAGFLATLDQQLALADEARAVDGFVAAAAPGPRTPEVQRAIEDNDGLFRKIMRTLFITQSFRDLPAEAQLHPAVQARMATHLDEIDTAVFELSDFLAGQTPEERARLRGALRDQPDTAMLIGEELDRHAASAGLSQRRRNQLRSMMSQATFRMRTEAPGALIDEYTAKVTRLRGARGGDALAISLSEKMGQRAFWKYQQHLAQTTSGAPGTVTASEPAPVGSMPNPNPTPAPAASSGSRPGGGLMRAGGYMMGIGVVVFGASALLVDTADGFVVGMTVGALLVAIGFVTLIIGAIIRASS